MRPPPDRIDSEFRAAWRKHGGNPSLFWLIIDGRIEEYGLTGTELASLFARFPPPERPSQRTEPPCRDSAPLQPGPGWQGQGRGVRGNS